MTSLAVRWDQSLIEKYNYAGPRYTSYPTALEFNESFGFEDFSKAAGRYPQRPLSLYVHIPFCHKLCYYCGCNKIVTRHQDKADIYLDALEREIQTLAPQFVDRQVTQLHWGGGTPTFLNEAQIRRLMGMLRSHFQIETNAEISIEIDPREITLDTMDLLAELGFMRLSVGIQDFNLQVQQAINRVQDEAFIKALLVRAREVGFQSINLDLIYGLPFQTPESFHKTLQEVKALHPDRLSVFNYAHLPSHFASQRKIKEADLPTPEQKLTLLRDTINDLVDSGYQFIGMDHFAHPDDSLAIAQRQGILHRNFQGYTTQGECDLLGLGVSSISMLGDDYSQNQKTLQEYYAQVRQQGHAQWKGLVLSRDDIIRRDVIKALMCNFTLEFAEIDQRYHIDFHIYFERDLAELKPLENDGLLTVTAEGISVSPTGRLLIRNIAMCFDTYLRQKRHERQFSRVI
ncbi:oxygen-independent coproporphyrinogen III oxidase [Celerinatantimonas sp. YJH-8]|uniref:oxygen-independent coproporphyrinogen III oxidase n=1 Tax=Celerinatantimonas sp. YJH-8 TaxID=3228714 RepID=UPI0038BF3C2D